MEDQLHNCGADTEEHFQVLPGEPGGNDNSRIPLLQHVIAFARIAHKLHADGIGLRIADPETDGVGLFRMNGLDNPCVNHAVTAILYLLASYDFELYATKRLLWSFADSWNYARKANLQRKRLEVEREYRTSKIICRNTSVEFGDDIFVTGFGPSFVNFDMRPVENQLFGAAVDIAMLAPDR